VDYVKRTKQVWKSVFGKEPEVKWDCPDGSDSYLLIDNNFSLILMENTVETKTIRGTKKEKVMGWSAGVEIVTYSYQDGPDSDVVDLGWERNFGDALQLIIAANARQIADNIMQAEYMAEAYDDEKKYAEEAKVLR